jgi:hypothetical protein
VLLSGSSAGALLVSLFNVEWGCSAQAGGMEGPKFCLFSVVLPVRCISNVSSRFYFRRHTFCFLPLAAILEFRSFLFNTGNLMEVEVLNSKFGVQFLFFYRL